MNNFTFPLNIVPLRDYSLFAKCCRGINYSNKSQPADVKCNTNGFYRFGKSL